MKRKIISLAIASVLLISSAFAAVRIPTKAEVDRAMANAQPGEKLVWIASSGKGTKYHWESWCSDMVQPYQVPISYAESLGFTECHKRGKACSSTKAVTYTAQKVA